LAGSRHWEQDTTPTGESSAMTPGSSSSSNDVPSSMGREEYYRELESMGIFSRELESVGIDIDRLTEAEIENLYTLFMMDKSAFVDALWTEREELNK